MRSTSEYIYSTLFEEGVNSDVTIVALGRYVCVCVSCEKSLLAYPGTAKELLPW